MPSKRNHNHRVFRPLGFVDCRRVTEHQFIQPAKCVGHQVIVKGGRQFLRVRIDMNRIADVAVIGNVLLLGFGMAM